MRGFDTAANFTFQELGEYLAAGMEQSCPYSALENYQSLMLTQGVQQRQSGSGKLLSRRSGRSPQAQSNKISSATKGNPDVFNNLRVLKDQTFLRNILTSSKSRTSKLSDYGLLDASQSKSTTSSFKDFRVQNVGILDSNPAVKPDQQETVVEIDLAMKPKNGSPTRSKVVTPTPTVTERYERGDEKRTNSAYCSRDSNKLSTDLTGGRITMEPSLGCRAKTQMPENYVTLEGKSKSNNLTKFDDTMTENAHMSSLPAMPITDVQKTLPDVNVDSADETYVTTFSRDSGKYTHANTVTDIASRKDDLSRASPLNAHYERFSMMKDDIARASEAQDEDSEYPKKLGRQVGRNGKLDFRYMRRYKTDGLKAPEVPSCLRRTRKPVWLDSNRSPRSERPSSNLSEYSNNVMPKLEFVVTAPETEYYKYKIPAPLSRDISSPQKQSKHNNTRGAHNIEPIKVKIPTMAAFMSDQSSRELGSEYSKESKTNSENISEAPLKDNLLKPESRLQIVGFTLNTSSGQTSTFGDGGEGKSVGLEKETTILDNDHEHESSDQFSQSGQNKSPSGSRPGSRSTSKTSKISLKISRPKSCDPSLDIRPAQISLRCSTPTRKLQTPSPAPPGACLERSPELTADYGTSNHEMKEVSDEQPSGISNGVFEKTSHPVNKLGNFDDVITDIVPNPSNEKLTTETDSTKSHKSEFSNESAKYSIKSSPLEYNKNHKVPTVMFDQNAYNGFQHSKFRRETDSRRTNRVVYNEETKVRYLKVKVGDSDLDDKGLVDMVMVGHDNGYEDNKSD